MNCIWRSMPGLQYKNLRLGCGCKRSCQPNSTHQECRCSFPSGSCKGEEYDKCLFPYYTWVPAGFPAGFKNSHPGINAKREIQGTAVLLRASPEPFLENAGGSFDGSVGREIKPLKEKNWVKWYLIYIILQKRKNPQLVSSSSFMVWNFILQQYLQSYSERKFLSRSSCHWY